MRRLRAASARADLDAAPARWWADCPGGVAKGPGVLRAGMGEPFASFGRPDGDAAFAVAAETGADVDDLIRAARARINRDAT